MSRENSARPPEQFKTLYELLETNPISRGALSFSQLNSEVFCVCGWSHDISPKNIPVAHAATLKHLSKFDSNSSKKTSNWSHRKLGWFLIEGRIERDEIVSGNKSLSSFFNRGTAVGGSRSDTLDSGGGGSVQQTVDIFDFSEQLLNECINNYLPELIRGEAGIVIEEENCIEQLFNLCINDYLPELIWGEAEIVIEEENCIEQLFNQCINELIREQAKKVIEEANCRPLTLDERRSVLSLADELLSTEIDDVFNNVIGVVIKEVVEEEKVEQVAVVERNSVLAAEENRHAFIESLNIPAGWVEDFATASGRNLMNKVQEDLMRDYSQNLLRDPTARVYSDTTYYFYKVMSLALSQTDYEFMAAPLLAPSYRRLKDRKCEVLSDVTISIRNFEQATSLFEKMVCMHLWHIINTLFYGGCSMTPTSLRRTATRRGCFGCECWVAGVGAVV